MKRKATKVLFSFLLAVMLMLQCLALPVYAAQPVSYEPQYNNAKSAVTTTVV